MMPIDPNQLSEAAKLGMMNGMGQKSASKSSK
jgi:hypothetical protein